MNLFDIVKPNFYIDESMKNMINEINQKLSIIEVDNNQKKEYMISKSKARSIHSSLAIEANSLSILDVINISDDKLVLGKKNEIQEVKNAIEVYNNIRNYNYKSEKDLLSVHQLMVKYLNDDNGSYRNHGEAVKKNGEIVYMAPESILVPSLMKSLFEFINNSKINVIILAAIFHYYFVSIHPFSDGNGRVARMWVSLMLINYDLDFEFIPIEEEIYLNQEDYYLAISKCHNNGNANEFIRFLLRTINSSLDKIIKNNNFVMSDIHNKIIELIVNDSRITQDKIASIIGISSRTVKRYFKTLIDNAIIERVGSDKTGYWQIIK